MAWWAWLAVPVVATVLASLLVWVRGLPSRTPSTRRSIRTHGRFLDALDVAAPSRPSDPARGD